MTCHPERPQGGKDLLRAFASHRSMEILRRCAPQNDMLHIGLSYLVYDPKPSTFQQEQ